MAAPSRVLADDQLAPLMSRASSSLQLARWDEKSPWTGCNKAQRAQRSRDEPKLIFTRILTRAGSLVRLTSRKALQIGGSSMGRAGFEPATLRLKVRPKKLRPSARSWNSLQIARVVVAANCNERCHVETSVYARLYARPSPNLTTTWAWIRPSDLRAGHHRHEVARTLDAPPGCRAPNERKPIFLGPVIVQLSQRGWRLKYFGGSESLQERGHAAARHGWL